MAADPAPLASAVLLPEAPTTAPSPPDSSKRQQSFGSSDSSNKRPRLDTSSLPVARDDGETPTSGGNRRSSGLSDATERKRGRRLFGALLGTLSQSSSSTAQRRRVDIEKKQQAKLKLQAEEYDEKKRAELDQLIAVRRQEQKKWDEQSMRIGHANTLAMAHFLQTTTEPRLYYKPWDLLRSDEARIKSQIADAEATIERECHDFETRRRKDTTEANGDVPRATGANGSNGVSSKKSAEPPDKHMVGSETNPPQHPMSEPTDDASKPPRFNKATEITSEPIKEHPDDVDGGEIVLEAEEDTVIY
ncbi:MAG: hypothetical protein M1838_004234 [Thelocarpon superellum]|nr:MAG: hypothetical protein M1838_004234 [Thelocarpon superellum]